MVKSYAELPLAMLSEHVQDLLVHNEGPRAADCYWITVFCYENGLYVKKIFMKFQSKYRYLLWFSYHFSTKVLKFL